MEQIKILNEDKFKEIYLNEELRNAVAFAHSCCNYKGEEQYKKALLYPISYKVTAEQIKEAGILKDKKKIEVLKENKHFNCNFKKMVVDYYNINCDSVLCWSIQ